MPDGYRDPDLVAEVPVTEVGHVRHDAHRHAVEDVVGHDTLLVEGLGEGLGNTAGAALAEDPWRRRLPELAVLAEVGLVGLPAGLPERVAVLADGDAGAAHQRDPRVAARVLQRGFVAEVTGGEVDPDALDGGALQHAFPGGDHAGRHRHVALEPGAGHDRGDLVGHHGVERVEQPVPGDAAVPDHVVDPGGRGHAVHRLDVQGALDVTNAVGHAVRRCWGRYPHGAKDSVLPKAAGSVLAFFWP